MTQRCQDRPAADLMRHVWQTGLPAQQPEADCQNAKRGGYGQERHHHHRCFLSAQRGEGLGRKRGRIAGQIDTSRQDERRTDPGSDRRAQRVERLCQGQPHMRTLQTAEVGDQRIGRHLKQGDAARQHEQRKQKHRIQADIRRRREQQTARGHHRQTDDDRTQIADTRQQQTRRNRHHQIRQKERELRQHRLGITERKQALELGNQSVDHHRAEAPHEEQPNDHRGHADFGFHAAAGLSSVGWHVHGFVLVTSSPITA